MWGIAIFDAQRATELAAYSFVIGTVGTLATLIGLYLTYRQASAAARDASETATELDSLKDRIARHDAAREVSLAMYALSIARSQVTSDWASVSQRCEDASQALMRINSGMLDTITDTTQKLQQVRARVGKIVDEVDAARVGKGKFPDQTKLLHVLRRHSETLNEILMALQKEAAQ